MSQHRGELEIESEPGHGSTFRIYLPTVQATAMEPQPQAAPGPSPRSARLLLVEDDAQVRDLGLRILRKAGYRVDPADNGEAALRLAGAGPPYDLLVTDVVMPGMDGARLAVELRELQPQCRVLFVSGYTDDRLSYLGIHSDRCDFLAKPYSQASLCGRVASILGRPG